MNWRHRNLSVLGTCNLSSAQQRQLWVDSRATCRDDGESAHRLSPQPLQPFLKTLIHLRPVHPPSRRSLILRHIFHSAKAAHQSPWFQPCPLLPIHSFPSPFPQDLSETKLDHIHLPLKSFQDSSLPGRGRYCQLAVPPLTLACLMFL